MTSRPLTPADYFMGLCGSAAFLSVAIGYWNLCAFLIGRVM